MTGPSGKAARRSPCSRASRKPRALLAIALSGWLPGLHAAPVPDHFARHLRTLSDLDQPAAVAFDGEGALWVVERGAGRVRAFAPDGQPLAALGRRGSGAGELLRPEGLAVAGGEVFVADTGNHRVQVFDAGGALLRAFGRRGREPGELCAPRALALSGGELLVADTGNARVQAFSLAGELLRVVEAPSAAGKGWLEPAALAARGTDLLVADAALDRVDLLRPDGAVVASFGAPGARPGLLGAPSALALGPGGLYVAERHNHRVQVLDLRGRPLYAWGEPDLEPRSAPGRLFAPAGLAVSPDGALLAVAEDLQDRCQLFVEDEGAPPPHPGPHALEGTVLRFGAGGACDGARMALIEPESGRVLVLDVREVEPQPRAAAIAPSEGPFAFAAPADAAIDPRRGWIWASDPPSGRLVALSAEDAEGHGFDPTRARWVRALDLRALCASAADARLAWPAAPGALAFGGDGGLYVADARNAVVLRLDESGRLTTLLGGFGDAPGELRNPVALCATRDGDGVWVADADLARVQRFHADGRPGALLAHPSLREPAGVAALADGRVLVSDRGASRLVAFAPDGSLEVLCGRGGGPGELMHPGDVWAGPEGVLYVLDNGNRRGQALAPDGRFLLAF